MKSQQEQLLYASNYQQVVFQVHTPAADVRQCLTFCLLSRPAARTLSFAIRTPVTVIFEAFSTTDPEDMEHAALESRFDTVLSTSWPATSARVQSA